MWQKGYAIGLKPFRRGFDSPHLFSWNAEKLLEVRRRCDELAEVRDVTLLMLG